MVRTKQKEQLFNNKVVDSFYKNNEIYSLEKQADNLWVVRKSNKTISITSIEAKARERFEKEKPILKGGEEQMSGLEAARETANKLKAEKVEVEEQQAIAKQEVKNQLSALQANPELAALYKQNAKVGSENIGGNAPYLRVHTATSTANELPDGTYPKDGNFFYAPTKEEFSEVVCHILTISKGFKVLQEQRDGSKKLQFNQIVGGVIVDNGEFKPFLMYVNGMKLQNLWKFGKDVNEYVRQGYPMFSMVVKLTTTQVKTEYGMKWVPVFTLVTDSGMPEIVLDVETFNVLKNGVATAEANISSIIEAKASEDTEVKVTPLKAGVSDTEAATNFYDPESEQI